MKIIILAAGRGTRLMPLTRNTPKPLIDLGNGKTLLEEQLESIQKSKVIDEIVLVIGYLAGQIESKIRFWKQNGLKITTVYNPFYDTSNNLISLWFAKHQMNEDFIITNGDNLFEYDVFRDLVNNYRDCICLTICKRRKYGDGDMKVTLDDKNNAIKVSKLIEKDKIHAESVGLVLVSGEKYRKLFKENLEELARDKEYINKYWLEVFNLMYNKGIPINTFEMNSDKWREVDFHVDLEDLKRRVQGKIIGD